MCDNVAEWVNYWYNDEYYNCSIYIDPKVQPGGKREVYRGGSFQGNRMAFGQFLGALRCSLRRINTSVSALPWATKKCKTFSLLPCFSLSFEIPFDSSRIVFSPIGAMCFGIWVTFLGTVRITGHGVKR